MPAITRSTLRQQLADALRDEVLAGRLPAGRQFTVKEIAEQYGVSATPVREALVDLTAQGLLDADQHRGFRVHEFTLDDFVAMIEARTLVIKGVFRTGGHGSLSPARAASRERQDALSSVRRRAVAARRAALAGDLDVLIGYDLRFWRELGELVGNSYVSDFLDRVRVHSWVFAVPHLRARRDVAGLLWAGHLDLVAAVEARDAVAVERIVTAYNDHSLTVVRSLVAPPAARPRPADPPGDPA
ncbi:GntR family transcriptional regulator [Streptomyces sp. TRM 70351]|uniref:GntR family transcriptional regulator n=1 Tax=Streptomyces sp. TRM 70351 TaxID=3116552 RepID=UPI002E7ADFD7|nr:GntR family transcriptional regulator [Streptomyces sp. TRM 70351]MEE1929871.1 GntR family transcriptional regulator [Streptomyces sp. TRM 70351]